MFIPSTRKALACALLSAVASFSSFTSAALVTYNSYTLDTDTNIVTGGGLEWLQWDETAGQSANAALATYGGDGWRLASNAEMAALFNAFAFGIAFDADENTAQTVNTGYSAVPSPSTESDVQFQELFGNTWLDPLGFGDDYQETSAWYGEDMDNDGNINLAEVHDDYINTFGSVDGRARILQDSFNAAASSPTTGVALVRAASEVPLPAASWLFITALAGLVGRKRLSRK